MSDIRLVSPGDRDRVVGTVVAAFDQDPAFRAFFGAGSDFGALATGFTGAMLDRRIASRTAWLGAGGDAVAMWDPPADGSETLGSSLSLPPDVLNRLGRYENAVHDALPAEPHWYLGILASHPSRRGEGLARRVAEPGLDAAASSGLPAVLETTNPDNVSLYERGGWRLVTRLEDVIGLTVWVLRRISEHLPIP